MSLCHTFEDELWAIPFKSATLWHVSQPNDRTFNSSETCSLVQSSKVWPTLFSQCRTVFCTNYSFISNSFLLCKFSHDKSWVPLNLVSWKCVCNFTVQAEFACKGVEYILHSNSSHALIQNVAGLYHCAACERGRSSSWTFILRKHTKTESLSKSTVRILCKHIVKHSVKLLWRFNSLS